MRLARPLGDPGKQMALPNVGGLHEIFEGLNKTQMVEEGRICSLPDGLSLAVDLLLSLDWDLSV